jgi:hypothetical protein
LKHTPKSPLPNAQPIVQRGLACAPATPSACEHVCKREGAGGVFLILLFFIFSSLFSVAQNPLVKMWDYRLGGEKTTLIIYNLLGTAVEQLTTNNQLLTEVDVHALPSGFYILELSTPAKTHRTTFIKE